MPHLDVPPDRDGKPIRLTVGVRVGCNLEQEKERKQTKSDRQWLGKSAQEWMRYNQHFCASQRNRVPG